MSAAVVPLLFVAGCGSSNDAPPSPLDVVTVGGTAKAPTVLIRDKPLSVKTTTTKVITPGKGPTLTKANGVKFSYLLVNGKDAKTFDSNFGNGKGPAGMYLSSATLIPGLSKGVTGQKVGSRILVAIPPADAFGAQGVAQKGVGPSDTILFLIDVISAMTPFPTAQGTAVPPKAGLPTVKVDGAKAAQITVPKAAAPTKLIVQPLIKGAGPVVKAGQQLKVAYTGVLWKNGKKFDASADHGGFETPIGIGQVIPAWDKGLVGQTAGSRVLLVVPPADGYGAKGSKGIGPKDTLVFVVDVLAAI